MSEHIRRINRAYFGCATFIFYLLFVYSDPDGYVTSKEKIFVQFQYLRRLSTSFRSFNNNLVAYNAIGKQENLALIEHSRRSVFKPQEWDCIIFMFVEEDVVPNDDQHLIRLQNELSCSVSRKPGIHWGDFLQFITPTFVSNYDYFALVLDDMFIPDRGQYAVDAMKMIETMEHHDIQVMSPAVHGEHHGQIENLNRKGLHGCVVEVEVIETFVQLFTRDAWKCYYGMLHYTGGRGWCYDVCFKQECPDLRFALDLSMHSWHTEKGMPPQNLIAGTDLMGWEPSKAERRGSYYNELPAYSVCARLKCSVEKRKEQALKQVSQISCPRS